MPPKSKSSKSSKTANKKTSALMEIRKNAEQKAIYAKYCVNFIEQFKGDIYQKHLSYSASAAAYNNDSKLLEDILLNSKPNESINLYDFFTNLDLLLVLPKYPNIIEVLNKYKKLFGLMDDKTIDLEYIQAKKSYQIEELYRSNESYRSSPAKVLIDVYVQSQDYYRSMLNGWYHFTKGLVSDTISNLGGSFGKCEDIYKGIKLEAGYSIQNLLNVFSYIISITRSP